MSLWRQKAIDCLPELKKDFEQPATSIYDVFIDLLRATVEAHKKNDFERLQKIYAFAEWCLRHKEKDLWNSAGVSFYEHLGDYEETRQAMPKWIKPDIYRDIRGLLQTRLREADFLTLDKHFLNQH
jgi:hypothetical protein